VRDVQGRQWFATVDDLDDNPYSEPGRALITKTAGHVRHLLASFDQLAERAAALEPVVTHGEPHSATPGWP